MKRIFMWLQHAISGEVYAAELDQAGRIIRLAGPTHYSERQGPRQGPEGWIDNAGPEADDDAEWAATEEWQPYGG